MPNILEILKTHSKIIIDEARDWGFTNVRVYIDTTPYQKQLLNLLVDRASSESSESFFGTLWLQLEQKLECAVNVCISELIDDNTLRKIKLHMASLEDYDDIETLFKDQHQAINPPGSYHNMQEKTKLAKEIKFIKEGLGFFNTRKAEVQPEAKQLLIIDAAELNELEQLVKKAKHSRSSDSLDEIDRQVKKICNNARPFSSLTSDPIAAQQNFLEAKFNNW